MPHPDLTLVIPAFNEQRRLPTTLDRIDELPSASGLDLEVLVVDDGSSDETVAVAADWIEHHRGSSARYRIVRRPHRGKGAAVRAGMLEGNGDVCGFCDADLCCDIADIIRLYSVVCAGADVAVASRRIEGATFVRRPPWYRRQAGNLFATILRASLAIPVHDTQCGLKLFRRQAAGALFPLQTIDGFAFDVEILALAVHLRMTIDEIPVRYAHGADSRVSLLRDATAMAHEVMDIRHRLHAIDGRAVATPHAVAPTS